MFEITVKNDFGQIIEKVISHSTQENEDYIKFFKSVWPNGRISVIGQW